MREPNMSSQPQPVTITAGPGTARIELAGNDVSRHLRGYTIEQHVGGPPQVVLHTLPKHGLVFDGLAQVAVATEADLGEAIGAFLCGINPAALDEAALARDDLDGSKNELTKAMLATLADWAQGRT